MVPHDKISSYIDNELTGEQEQEFLISLAASEGLRKAFRSELELKKVIHRDEVVTAPPRELRSVLFAALGFGAGASVIGAEAATATIQSAASQGILRALFATKASTIITAVGIGASALIGYGTHALVADDPKPQQQVVRQATPQIVTPTQPTVQQPVEELPAPQKSVASTASSHSASKHIVQKSKPEVKPVETVTSTIPEGVSGVGSSAAVKVRTKKDGQKPLDSVKH